MRRKRKISLKDKPRVAAVICQKFQILARREILVSRLRKDYPKDQEAHVGTRNHPTTPKLLLGQLGNILHPCVVFAMQVASEYVLTGIKHGTGMIPSHNRHHWLRDAPKYSGCLYIFVIAEN